MLGSYNPVKQIQLWTLIFIKPFFRTQNHTGSLESFNKSYGKLPQHIYRALWHTTLSNLKQKWFQGIMTCQRITKVITDLFVKTLNQVRTFFRNFRDSSSENHHVKAQILREREKTQTELKVFPPYRYLYIPDSSEEQSDNYQIKVCVTKKTQPRRLHTGIIFFNIKKTRQIVQLLKYLRPETSMSLAISNIVFTELHILLNK